MSLHMVYIHFETLLWPLFVFLHFLAAVQSEMNQKLQLISLRHIWALRHHLFIHQLPHLPLSYCKLTAFFLALAASFRVTHEQVVHCILKILSVEGKHLLHPCFQRTYWCTFSLCRHIHACQVEAVNKRQTIMMSRHPAVVTWWHSVRRSPDIIPLSFVHTV